MSESEIASRGDATTRTSVWDGIKLHVWKWVPAGNVK